MANKKITDLVLRSSVSDTCNFPTDDTIQTYRVTAAQLITYIKSKGIVGVYDAAVTYAITDFVYYSGLLYRSVSASNLANTPSSSPTKWLLAL